MAAVRRGTFGLIGPRYAIADDRVVVARRWSPLVLAIGLPIGAWLLYDGFRPHHHGQSEVGLGVVVALVGIMGLVASPLIPPATITVTPGAVVVGRRRLAKDDIALIEAVVQTTHGRSGGVVFRTHVLAINLFTMETVSMKLRRGGETTPDEVRAVVTAMQACLGATTAPEKPA